MSDVQSLDLSHLSPAQTALHANFVTSMRTLQTGLVRAAYYLAAISDRRVYRFAGIATINDDTAAIAGLSPGQTKSLLLLARRLPGLPIMQTAVEGQDSTKDDASAATSAIPAETTRSTMLPAVADDHARAVPRQNPVLPSKVVRSDRRFTTLGYCAEDFARFEALVASVGRPGQSRESLLLELLEVFATRAGATNSDGPDLSTGRVTPSS